MALETSLYMRPMRSNGASIFAPPEDSSNAFLAIKESFLKALMVWKLAGKNVSRLFQDAQEGKSSGIDEGFG